MAECSECPKVVSSCRSAGSLSGLKPTSNLGVSASVGPFGDRYPGTEEISVAAASTLGRRIYADLNVIWAWLQATLS